MEPASIVRDLVVIGASAGGIDALIRLTSTLPVDLQAPLVIAQHLDPDRASRLGEILSMHSTLPVRMVSDEERLAPATVYVVPANRDVEITDHTITLRDDQLGRPKPSIDLLLTSASAIFEERLIAVILTGTGSDGAEGARRVKAAGGTVVIQNPETAQYPGLPLSLPTAVVDIVTELEVLGVLLRDLVNGTYVPPSTDDERRMRTLLDQVRARSGIDFNVYRQPTIRRRLQRRMVDTGRQSIEAYVTYLQRHPQEYQRLVSSFLIKVTDFFRDADLFDRLRTRILPDLLEEARTRGNELRLWSAGCATGEEAYSLAILVAELLGDELEQFSVRVFATDVDPDAIVHARRGVYSGAALNHLSSELRSRYFAPVDSVYEVKRAVRRLVVFAPHDLGQRPPFPRVDLILCRNVLIYFTPELQRRVLQSFAFSLRPAGRLVLGKSETTSPLPAYFSLDDSRLRVYRRLDDRISIPTAEIKGTTTLPERSSPRSDLARVELGLTRPRLPRNPPRTPTETAERLLLELPVGVIVVDQRFDVRAINGAARRLLSIHAAAIGEDLIHLARRVPAEPLRALLDRAFAGQTGGERIEVRPLDVPTGTIRILEISAFPQEVESTDTAVTHAVLLVSDVTPPERALDASELPSAPERESVVQALDRITALAERGNYAADASEAIASARPALEAALSGLDRLEARVRELEDATRELLASNQSLNAMNDDLRGQAEDLLLANEEAQAAMEEVETLSEEQQASNEELETLNEELQATVEELNTTNDDLEARGLELEETALSRETERSRLEAILASLGDAVLVVGRDGRHLRSNAAFDRMFGTTGADFVPEDERGVPLALDDRLEQRAAAGETFSMPFIISGADGARRWFEANARPIEHDGQQGGVLVIRDITDRSLLRLQEEFLAVASHELRTPLTALRGYLQLHLRQLQSGGDPGRIERSGSTALQQTERLTVLVDDLLEIGRLQTGRLRLNKEVVDLAALVERVGEMGRSLAHGQTIRLELPGEPVLVDGDPVRLEQVLLNLLTNAITHAAESDRIDVTLQVEDGGAVLQVQDYGPGIAPDELGRLFTRFHQGLPGGQGGARGLGLGLYIAKEIVLAHGGTIDVDSTVETGSRFLVHLPFATGTTE
jgi:two-component system, chemotaxis family, CheB/CheR fusion protein